VTERVQVKDDNQAKRRSSLSVSWRVSGIEDASERDETQSPSLPEEGIVDALKA